MIGDTLSFLTAGKLPETGEGFCVAGQGKGKGELRKEDQL